MSLSPRQSRRVAAWSAAAALAGLTVAGGAFAAPAPPTGVSVTPSGPTNAGNVQVGWGGSDGAVSYVGGFVDNPAVDPAPVAVSPGPIAAPAGDGVWYFKVAAVGPGGVETDSSPYAASGGVAIDRTPPTIGGASLSGDQGVEGWYRTLRFTFSTCLDPAPGTIGGAACTNVPWTGAQGAFENATVPVQDDAGNTANAALPPFKFDSVDPTTRPGLIGPPAVVGRQPTFSWSKSADATSLINEYRGQWQRDEEYDPDGWKTLATVPEEGDYTAPPSVWTGGPLPEFTPLVWRVVAVDHAGNTRASLPGGGRALMIDPPVPAPPRITGGPTGPTQDTTPSFSWDGPGSTYEWSITPVGSSIAIRGDAGPAKQVEVPGALPDGAYIFRVKQFVVANPSEEAIRSFVVDTTPPAPPSILTRPTFP